MNYNVGDIVIGKIKDVKPYAAFLSFDGGYSGLLHISEISDGFVKDIELYTSCDDEIKVKILQIDQRTKFMRVSLKQVPEQERYSTHQNTKRRIPKIDKEEFVILKEHLDEWIDKTYEEAIKKEQK